MTTTYTDIDYSEEVYADNETIYADSELYYATGEDIELPITYS